jgi:hypothetical protein
MIAEFWRRLIADHGAKAAFSAGEACKSYGAGDVAGFEESYNESISNTLAMTLLSCELGKMLETQKGAKNEN